MRNIYSLVEVNGDLLYIHFTEIKEDQTTLVFLHDSLGCVALWRDFPEQLGKMTNCHVLVYDRQGYGKSSPFTSGERTNDYMEVEADKLNSLLEQLGIQNAILFGHSDGGSISLMAAAKYPARIKGIITEGAHIFVEDITLRGIKDAVEAYHSTNLKERLQKYHGDKTEAVFWAWAKTWLSDDFRSWNIERFLPQIKCPALIIQGENDEYGSLKQVDGIINQVSGATSQLIIPTVGHNPHKEAKQVVLEYATAFINSIVAECK